MSYWFKSLRVAAVVASVALAGQMSLAQPAHTDAGMTLSIDQLYPLRSLIGTVPEGYSWSPDGRQLAFLWNDQGYSFRDVWVYSAATGEKRQLTRHARGSAPEAEHRGISEVAFIGSDRLAYVLDGKLYVLEGDGASRAIETDKAAVRQLALSPDGRQLGFVCGDPTDPMNRVTLGGILWTRPVDAAGDVAARRIFGDPDPKVVVQDYQWSKDSSRIAFNMADNRLMPERDIYYYAKGDLQNNRVARAFPGDETTRYRIGVVDLGSLDTRYFERPDSKHHIFGFGLSGDGKRLFISSSDMLVEEHTIYMYDVATARRQTFYTLLDERHLRPDWRVEWAPRDDGLIILTDRDGWLHLYHQRTAGAKPKQLTRGQWEIASFAVDDARRQIYFLANEAALPERQIYRVPLAGGRVERVSGPTPGTHQPVFSPDFRYAASLFTNDYTPPELVINDLTVADDDRQATRSPTEEFYRQTWPRVTYVEFPSHVDGVPLIARLILPPGYDPARRYPMIVGPVYSDSVRNQWGDRRWNPNWGIDRYFAAHGYLVLSVNVRGSWGQGRDHNKGLHHSYGGIDIDDLESGVRYMVAQGHADPERVGIWGSSYGGLMTVMSLAKKPGVYAAGVAGAPATNVAHAYPSQMWVMGPAEGPDMPERYQRQSALYQADGIRDPLMIIHGTRDPVVLYSDTVALTEKLIANEQPFELVTLPGASHVWGGDNLPQARFAFKKIVDFFDRHLKP